MDKIAVVLPIKKYNKLIAKLEDETDIQAYRKVKSIKTKTIQFDKAVKEIETNRKKKK